MRKRQLAILIGLVILISTATAFYTAFAVPPRVTGSVVTQAPATPSPTDSSAPGVFAGEGGETVLLWVDKGVWTFRATHEGESSFSVDLSREDGWRQNIAEADGNARALTVLNILDTDLYALEVAADGLWIIEIQGCNCGSEG